MKNQKADIETGPNAAGFPLELTVEIDGDTKPVLIEFNTNDVVRHHRQKSWESMDQQDRESFSEDYGCFIARRKMKIMRWDHVQLDIELFEAACSCLE